MHGKFNCITVTYNGTQHGIYIILEYHKKFIIQMHFILSITKQLQKLTMGIETLFDAKQVQPNRIFD